MGKHIVSGTARPEERPGASAGRGARAVKQEAGGIVSGLRELPERNRAWERV